MLLLFVAITGIVMTFSESVLCAGELPSAHGTVNISLNHETQQIHINKVQSDSSQSQSTDDHSCLDECGCPCHAPLLSMPATLSTSRSYTSLLHAELTKHIPEVYLSLFVPPDSAAV
jgi:hypothetical protein